MSDDEVAEKRAKEAFEKGQAAARGEDVFEHDELALKAEWMKEAREQTLDTLTTFLKKLSEFPHEYGTIPRAIAAAAIAAAFVVNRSNSSGGITGFQSGFVAWDFLEEWGSFGPGPKKILQYDDMLFPQMDDTFRSISSDTWKYLQKQAKAKLEAATYAKETKPHPEVKAHWESIVKGVVPFGYAVVN